MQGLDPKTWWYLSRATGVVSWVLLALSVLWGLFLSTRTLGKTAPPAWLLDLHRHLGGLAVVFVGVHLAGLAADGYVGFGPAELFVPMASTWKPGAVAWGIAAWYLLLAIEVTSLLQRRLPRPWWRRIHHLSFPLYAVATVHVFAAGTDRHHVLLVWAAVVVTTLIVFLTIVRLLASRAAPAATSRIPAAARAGVVKPAATEPAAEAIA